MADLAAGLAMVAFGYLAVEWASFLALRPLARRLGVEVGRFQAPSAAVPAIEANTQVGIVVSPSGPNRWLFRPVMTWERLRIGRYGPLELCLGELSRGGSDSTVSVRAPIGFAVFFGLGALGILFRMDRNDSLLEWVQVGALACLGPAVAWFGSRRAALDLVKVAGLVNPNE